MEGPTRLVLQRPHLLPNQHIPLMQHARHARARIHTRHRGRKHYGCVWILGSYRWADGCVDGVLFQRGQRLQHFRQLDR
jgi:hypothetical protein